MGLARLDPHGVAPVVLGCVYTLVQTLANNSDEHCVAILITLEIAQVIGLWTDIEEKQTSKNQNSQLERLKEMYEKLSQAVVRLFEKIIELLTTMMMWFDEPRWRKCFRAARVKSMFTEICRKTPWSSATA
jgi:hypothetical protein